MPVTITIPMLNPNEPEAILAALHVSEGQYVSKGEVLCTLETTKSIAELQAENDGYVVGLRFRQGQTARAGELLCYLAESASWSPPAMENAPETEQGGDQIPAGLRITAPALALARQMRLPLEKLPLGPLVTESLVTAHLNQTGKPDLSIPQSAIDPTAIIVYGGGGHGKALIELLRAVGSYRLAGIVDDGLSAGQTILGLPVLGGSEVLPELSERGVRLAANAVGGIGDLAVRVKVFQRLAQAGFTCPAAVHPVAYLEPSASISPGVQVFPHAYVGSEARLGFGTIVNTGAIVSHDCQLGNYVNISPGAILAGGVQVGDGSLVGMGATVNLLVKIGNGARIGNGATVKGDVPQGSVVRAGSIWPE
jgi:sugar O-acyltransferase (sialic acid O-acetyltransferase NeuD family)